MSKMRNKNLTVKILALFISLLLWSYVRSEVNPNIIREFKGINVEYMNERILNDKGFVVIEPTKVKISVKVSGRRSDVNSIELKDIVAEVDLSEVTEGTKKIPIDVRIPFKVDLEDISKRYISFEIDSLVSEEKSISINIIGASKGDIIKESIISPEAIKVSGPSTLIDKIYKVIVNIDIDKINSNDIMKLPVKVVDKKGNLIEGIKTSHDMVEVSISLLKSKSKQVSIKPILTGHLDEGYKVISTNTNPKTVTIRGLEKDLAKIEVIETEAIDVTNFKENETIDVNLKIPEGIKVDSGKEKIKVNIKIGGNITKEISVPISQTNFENIKEGFKISFDENIEKNINIKITGDKDILEDIKLEDLKLNTDLSELEEGEHNVTITIVPLKDIIIEHISPEMIKINIEPV